MSVKFKRIILCKGCKTKHTVVEEDGEFKPMICRKCRVVLFYYHSKKKGVLASRYTLIYTDEKTYTEQKIVAISLLRKPPKRNRRDIDIDNYKEEDEEEEEVENWN